MGTTQTKIDTLPLCTTELTNRFDIKGDEITSIILILRTFDDHELISNYNCCKGSNKINLFYGNNNAKFYSKNEDSFIYKVIKVEDKLCSVKYLYKEIRSKSPSLKYKNLEKVLVFSFIKSIVEDKSIYIKGSICIDKIDDKTSLHVNFIDGKDIDIIGPNIDVEYELEVNMFILSVK